MGNYLDRIRQSQKWTTSIYSKEKNKKITSFAHHSEEAYLSRCQNLRDLITSWFNSKMVTGCAPGVIQEAVCVIKSKALHQWVVQGFNSIFVQATKYPAAPVHQHTQIFEEQIQGSGRCQGHVELIATAGVAKHGMISALSIKLDFRDQWRSANWMELKFALLVFRATLSWRIA